MLWNLPRSIVVALLLSWAALWVGVAAACAQEEVPCVLVWSAPSDVDEDATAFVFELRRIGVVTVGSEWPNGDYLIIGGPGFDNERGMVCFDAMRVEGNPNPGAKFTAEILGQTICYERSADQSEIYYRGLTYRADPAKTAEAYEHLCQEPERRSGT